MGGEFNLSLNKRDIWGEVARYDPLANIFTHFFEVENLIDVEYVKIDPRWRNARR